MINTYEDSRGSIMTYPEQIIFLRNYNALTLEATLQVSNIKSIQATAIVTYIKNGVTSTRTFVVTTDGSQVVFDLTYFFRSLGAGVLITQYSVNYTVTGYTTFNSGDYTYVGLASTIANGQLRNGYSLPNRQNFSETSVFVPNQQVWDRYTNTTGETPTVEFFSNLPVVINGQHYAPFETIPIASDDEDCKTVVGVDVEGIYDAWKQCYAPTTYGITAIWANHVYAEQGSELYEFVFNSTDVQNKLREKGFIPKDGRFYMCNQEDVEIAGWTEESGIVVMGMILVPISGEPHRYRLFGCSYIGVLEGGLRDIAFILFDTQNIIINTDRYDDFLSLDYHTKNGGIQPTYSTTIGGNSSGNVTFLVANEYFKNEADVSITGLSFAVRGIYFAINTWEDPTRDLNTRLTSLLGISSWREDSSYDYTLIESDTGKRIFLHGLSYGWTFDVAQIIGSTMGFDAIFNGDIYSIWEQNQSLFYLYNGWNGATPLGYFKSKTEIEVYNPIYNLWWFWNAKPINQGGIQLSYNGLRFYDNLGLPWLPSFCFPTKVFDNAISTPQWYKGVSFMKCYQTTAIAKIDKTEIELAPQSIFFFPNPAEYGYWRSSDVILKDNNGRYYNIMGSEVNTEDEAGRFSIILEDPGRFTFSNLDDNNDGMVDLVFTGLETNRNWITVPTFHIQSSDDETFPMTYYHFPYNCHVPTMLITNETLFRYMSSPAMTVINGCGGGGDKRYQLEVVKYYLNPFNVGRNIVIDGNTHANPPENSGWFSLTDAPRTQDCDGSSQYSVITNSNGKMNSYNVLYNSLLTNDIVNAPYYARYKNSNYQLIATNPNIITTPCTDSGVVVHDFSRGAISNYNIIIYSLCNTDQVFWLEYENMDGFVRWLPFEIKRRVYENTMGDFKFVTPTTSSINAYPLQAPLSLQEKITCFIGDVPQDCYIEDILYSPYLRGWNWDGTVSFECVLEENEIVRDNSQELEDFVFNFIKKK